MKALALLLVLVAVGATRAGSTTPTLTIADVTTHETNVDIGADPTVTLTPASAETVTVHYATVDGTADSTDYVGDSGTLTFAPGVTTARIPIMIKADALDEPDETFFVDLSAPEHATVERGRGTVTIVDDDPAPFRLLDAWVDARWSVHRTHTRVTRFAIHKPAGANVRVRCRGEGCPVRVGARLRPGAVVRVRFETPYQPLIGRFYEYRIRASKRPRFTALCLPPGALSPKPC